MSKKKGLKVYFVHSDKMDYNNLIYLPVLRSNYLSNHKLVFGKTKANENTYFKDIMDECDLIVVELTNPDVGFNMQLKQALMSKKPILSLAQKDIGYDEKYQKLLKNVIGYSTEEEFRYFVETFVKTYDGKIDSGHVDPTVVLGLLN